MVKENLSSQQKFEEKIEYEKKMLQMEFDNRHKMESTCLTVITTMVGMLFILVLLSIGGEVQHKFF